MLAFSSAASALQWCLLAQEAAMYAPWPPSLLALPELSEVHAPGDGTLLFRGPRLKMGVCEGVPQSMEPDHVGRCVSDSGLERPRLSCPAAEVPATARLAGPQRTLRLYLPVSLSLLQTAAHFAGPTTTATASTRQRDSWMLARMAGRSRARKASPKAFSGKLGFLLVCGTCSPNAGGWVEPVPITRIGLSARRALNPDGAQTLPCKLAPQ
jgi:hypothetical protein